MLGSTGTGDRRAGVRGGSSGESFFAGTDGDAADLLLLKKRRLRLRPTLPLISRELGSERRLPGDLDASDAMWG